MADPAGRPEGGIPPPELLALLERYPESVRGLALATRSFVLEAVPVTVETIDAPSRLVAYGRGSRLADTVCTIMPQRGWVNLGVFRGASLPDPSGLLTGQGKVHRHVAIRSSDDLSPALADLLRRAAAR